MNWIELKSLYSIYVNGSIKLNNTLSNSGEFNFLTNSLNVLDKTASAFSAQQGFNDLYREKYLEKFMLYNNFLEINNILKPQIRFNEADIIILMKIEEWKQQGTLNDLRNQIIASDESLRGVSLMFFKNEKYLDDKPSLTDALKKILEVESFSNEKGQQYIYKLECHKPVAIVLCENLDFLTKPNKPRQHGIELWYAGGKNISKLDFADTRGLPIYYSCDWDYDGLFVIYPLVRAKIPSIRLLTPTGSPKGIVETEHNSKWEGKQLDINSILNDSKQKDLFNDLLKENQWIIEESNSLLVMLGIA
jgi:hypothetical protein